MAEEAVLLDDDRLSVDRSREAGTDYDQRRQHYSHINGLSRIVYTADEAHRSQVPSCSQSSTERNHRDQQGSHIRASARRVDQSGKRLHVAAHDFPNGFELYCLTYGQPNLPSAYQLHTESQSRSTSKPLNCMSSAYRVFIGHTISRTSQLTKTLNTQSTRTQAFEPPMEAIAIVLCSPPRNVSIASIDGGEAPARCVHMVCLPEDKRHDKLPDQAEARTPITQQQSLSIGYY